jgi:hypothetical protein
MVVLMMDTYGHLFAGMHEETARGMDAMLRSQPGQIARVLRRAGFGLHESSGAIL